MASHAVRAPVARPAGALRAPRTKRAARAVRSRAVDADTLESATIDLVLPTDEARVSFQFDKVVVNDQEGPVIFVTGVALGSAAEAAGVVPGQRLVALSDPVNDGDLWFLDGTERLAFVLDAIRSTRQYSTTLVFESEVSVTKEMVDRARPPPKEEKDDENEDDEEDEEDEDEKKKEATEGNAQEMVTLNQTSHYMARCLT